MEQIGDAIESGFKFLIGVIVVLVVAVLVLLGIILL